VKLALRPERLSLAALGEAHDLARKGLNTLAGKVRAVVYRGEMLHLRVTLADGTEMIAAAPNHGQLHQPLPWKEGDACLAVFSPDDLRILEDEPT
jgi:ABC-type Fe3+/spermidine/putrescine transport system ATPase subunit